MINIRIKNGKLIGINKNDIIHGILTIPPGVKEVSANICKNCDMLTEVRLPFSVKKVKRNAFCNCINLQKVVLPSSEIYIGSKAFANCRSLTWVNTGPYTKWHKSAFLACLIDLG